MHHNNTKNPTFFVHHQELERTSTDSKFKSVCPVCKVGILTMRRSEDDTLLNKDNCYNCGQPFIYIDVMEGNIDIVYG